MKLPAAVPTNFFDCGQLKNESKFQASNTTKLDVELLLMKAENSMHKLNLESKLAEILRLEIRETDEHDEGSL